MLDQVFGESNFQNEIVWKRSSAHSNAKQGASTPTGSAHRPENPSMAYPSFPLNVWLVENNNPFAAAPGGAAEVAQFRSGVVALLKQWYAKVIQNAAAPPHRPGGRPPSTSTGAT